jgi:IclR family acetate operon transcriptional repressor
VLQAVVVSGGRASVAQVAEATHLPMATAHRLLRTLTSRRYLRQLADRSYVLGFALVSLGDAAKASLGVSVDAVLRRLVAELGETANLAVLSGHEAEYVAQAPSTHSMRMFTEVGTRVDLHSTGVGKAMLATLPLPEILRIARTYGLPGHTVATITSEAQLLAECERIRACGYARDDEEHEIGVRCVAVAVTAGHFECLAVSVSGPTVRVTDDFVDRAIPEITAAANRLRNDLIGHNAVAAPHPEMA